MTEKQINRHLRRQFSPIGWVLLGYYALINLFVLMALALDYAKQTLWSFAAGDFFPSYDTDAIWNNGWGYILAGAVMILILYSWKGSDFWNREVFAKENRMERPAVLCAMVFCMGAQLVNGLWISALEAVLNAFGRSVMPLLESVSGSTDSISMFLYSALAAPLVEELLFRGFLLRILRPYGKRFAIFGSALVFGLFHGNLLQLPYAFLAGLILGYLAAEYSIGWAIGIHIFNNLVLADGLTRLSQLLPLEAADMLNGAVFGLAFFVSVGILWRNRSQILAWRRGEWIDRRCVKCLLTNLSFFIFLLAMLINMVTTLFAY